MGAIMELKRCGMTRGIRSIAWDIISEYGIDCT